MDRRVFFKSLGTGAVSAALATPAQASQPASAASTDRQFWIGVMRRLADPVLSNLANETLKARMPVEQVAGANREPVTHLEELGRLMAGLPASDDFWSAPPQPWTSVRAWSGQPFPIDRATA